VGAAVPTDSDGSVGPVTGVDVLDTLVAAALDGLALLDADGRYLHVNPAGARILGLAGEDLVGAQAVFLVRETGPSDGPVAGGAPRCARWCRPGSRRECDLEYRVVPVASPGPVAAAVAFRDVTELRLQQRRFTAFATAAANVADAGSLRGTLDAICAEVVHTTELAGAQILLMDAEGQRMRVHGAAPAEAWPENFASLLEAARRRGAELTSLDALRTGRPVVCRHRKARLLTDPAWEPLHGQFRRFEWDDFVSAPLLVRDRPVGALNAYYRPGHDPSEDDVAFLASMADHAAVAVENARLLADSRDRAALAERHRLARELHDSVCQQLFSMTLHIRAAQLARPSDHPEDEATRRSLAILDQLAHAALEDMRGLILELYPTLLHNEGLVAVLRQQAASVASRVGLEVTVDAPDERLDIDPDAELDAYRLVQEALHNCVKHAHAGSVRIRIGPPADDPDALVLEVADDGLGFDPADRTTGMGLVSMRERAERLGGKLAIASRPGGGTVVQAVVPRLLAHAAQREQR
jgi:signal transduction histidine kinase